MGTILDLDLSFFRFISAFHFEFTISIFLIFLVTTTLLLFLPMTFFDNLDLVSIILPVFALFPLSTLTLATKFFGFLFTFGATASCSFFSFSLSSWSSGTFSFVVESVYIFKKKNIVYYYYWYMWLVT